MRSSNAPKNALAAMLLSVTGCGYAGSSLGPDTVLRVNSSTKDNTNHPKIDPGTLTAGAWDDNINYDFYKTYVVRTATRGVQGAPSLSADEREHAHAASVVGPGAKKKLDVALMIDTTGSMGDELAYLQVELEAIADSVVMQFPSIDQRWAVVVYRDRGDDYLTRPFNFTPDVARLKTELGEQRAGGGGDYPESPEVGLADTLKLSWRSDQDAARIIFWIADAPHHADREAEMTKQIRAARDAAIHVYPIAASGADDLLESTMRAAAQLTGGRYLFLTDDSGIGDPHKVPEIPCFFVTKLSAAMSRMIAIEISGQYREPEASQIIRTGGDPRDGHCTLDQDRVVAVF